MSEAAVRDAPIGGVGVFAVEPAVAGDGVREFELERELRLPRWARAVHADDLSVRRSRTGAAVRIASLRDLGLKRAAVMLALWATGASMGCGGSGQEGEYVALPASSFAGLKAGMACSATFVGGRPLEGVLVDELGGLPAAARGAGDPVVDRARRSVSVAYDPHEPPRVAVHRPGRGCTTLPPGAGPELVTALPNPEIERSSGGADRDAWPEGVVRPPDGLAAVVEAAFDGRTYGEGTKTIGVAVVHRGRLVAERYRQGFGPHTPYRTWSAAKMLTNALVGILVGRGVLDPEAPAPIPEWAAGDDPRADITIAHLLHMSSGLEQKGAGCYAVYFDGADAVRETVEARLEERPGSRWSYANRDTLLLGRAMRNALGDDAYWRFPVHDLLDRIGMRSTVLETDPHGNYVLSSQVFSTPRDLARLGLLFLNDGVWKGVRILPAGWVASSTRPAPARKRGLRGLFAYGIQGLVGYGAQIWLYDPIPGLFAHRAYSGIGHRGQYVTIVPSRELVVVRTGLDPEEGDVLWRQDRFFADLIDSL
jgi:CubicO group peptidase (beta-lactamase class C family)